VFLLSPDAGREYTREQSIACDCIAFDPEDGATLAAPPVWRSDRDGLLGAGERLVLRATNLTEGIHTLTAQASDSTGASAEASVRIRVSRFAPARLRTPSLGADGSIRLPVVADPTVEHVLEQSPDPMH
jgi:hypothetical protein